MKEENARFSFIPPANKLSVNAKRFTWYIYLRKREELLPKLFFHVIIVAGCIGPMYIFHPLFGYRYIFGGGGGGGHIDGVVGFVLLIEAVHV